MYSKHVWLTYSSPFYSLNRLEKLQDRMSAVCLEFWNQLSSTYLYGMATWEIVDIVAPENILNRTEQLLFHKNEIIQKSIELEKCVEL